MTAKQTGVLLPTKPSFHDGCVFKHCLSAETSVSHIISTRIVPNGTTRLC